MTARLGVVERTQDGATWVRVHPERGCGRCDEPGGCRSDLIGEVLGPRCTRYAVDLAPTVPPGTAVRLEVSARAPLFAALLAYGLPLAGLLAGALAAHLLHGDDRATALAGVTGLVLMFPVARHLARHRRVGPHLAIHATAPDQPPAEHSHG